MIRLIWHRMRQRYVIMWLLNVTFQRIQQIQQYYRTIAEFAEFAEFAEMWHSKSLLELLNVTAKVIQNKGCNYLRCHDNFCEFGNACSWSNRAFQNRIKITIMEEMRVKTQVQTDLFKTWFLEVQGARPSELTRKLATTALNIYCIHILSFSAYLPQLAGTRYLDDIQKMVFIVG